MNYNRGRKPVVQYTLSAPSIEQLQNNNRAYGSRFRNEKRQGPLTNTTSICFNCAETGHSMKQCAIYKVRMCRWWLAGNCGYEQADGTNTCLFAHGESEQRQSGIRCVQTIYDNGKITINGCRQIGHCFDEWTFVAPTAISLLLENNAPADGTLTLGTGESSDGTQNSDFGQPSNGTLNLANGQPADANPGI